MAGISFPLSALLQSSKPWGLTEVPLPAMSSNTRKRPAPPPPQKPSPAAQTPKHHAASQEDEFVDEDVYLDESETLILEDEEILRDIEDRRTVACRLAKWTRPPLSDAYVSQSRSVGESISTRSGVLHFHSARVSAKNLNFFLLLLFLLVFQQLEIDYVIGETHKVLLPNSSGSAAIIRIFGVTSEG